MPDDENPDEQTIRTGPSERVRRQREDIGKSVGRSNPSRDEESDEDTDQVP